jgi:hypothetical protein
LDSDDDDDDDDDDANMHLVARRQLTEQAVVEPADLPRPEMIKVVHSRVTSVLDLSAFFSRPLVLTRQAQCPRHSHWHHRAACTQQHNRHDDKKNDSCYDLS